ncbi:MAG: nuclear transport factor 2 family protein [Rhodobacterales bacterium]|nr:nuclear transport factor 2 family protein [Rhodobacterales bacterium]
MTQIHDQNSAILEALINCEDQVWQALVRGDPVADAAALDDDFLGVYPDGFAQKSDHVAQLENGPTVRDYTLGDVRVLVLGDDHAVLSYRAEYRRYRQDAVEVMFISSIWRRKGAGWINVFSQDTPWAEESPP